MSLSIPFQLTLPWWPVSTAQLFIFVVLIDKNHWHISFPILTSFSYARPQCNRRSTNEAHHRWVSMQHLWRNNLKTCCFFFFAVNVRHIPKYSFTLLGSHPVAYHSSYFCVCYFCYLFYHQHSGACCKSLGKLSFVRLFSSIEEFAWRIINFGDF